MMKSVKRYDGKIEHCDNGGYVTFADYKKLEARLENATGREMKLKALIAVQQAVIDQRNGECDQLINELAALREKTAPVAVPDKLPKQLEVVGYNDGWNACRAEVLRLNSGSKPSHDSIRHRHAAWSDKTFGDVGPIGPLKHLSAEALEAAAEPGDLLEWADMQFLLWDAQRRAGISDNEIIAAMEEKLTVNMERKWPDPKDGEPRMHIKAAGGEIAE